jgi:hypothetical protein
MRAEKKAKELVNKFISYSVPSDVIELLRIIAKSDDAMYREEARKLIRKYCN